MRVANKTTASFVLIFSISFALLIGTKQNMNLVEEKLKNDMNLLEGRLKNDMNLLEGRLTQSIEASR